MRTTQNKLLLYLQVAYAANSGMDNLVIVNDDGVIGLRDNLLLTDRSEFEDL